MPFFLDKKEESFDFLIQADKKCEQILRRYFKIVFGGYYGLIIGGVVTSVVLCYRKYGQFERKHVFIPYHVV